MLLSMSDLGCSIRKEPWESQSQVWMHLFGKVSASVASWGGNAFHLELVCVKVLYIPSQTARINSALLPLVDGIHLFPNEIIKLSSERQTQLIL